MAGEKREEKRRFKRFPSEGIIDIIVLDRSEAEDLIRSKARSVNMSVGGVLRLDVFEAAGRVVRVKGAPEIGYEIAVSIDCIPGTGGFAIYIRHRGMESGKPVSPGQVG